MRVKVWTLAIVMSVMLLGCSADEVIRVGTPTYHEGTGTLSIYFETEITDVDAVAAVRKIVVNSKDIEQPIDLSDEPDLFFSLDRPKEGISEIRRSMWFEADGSAVLYNESTGYSTVTKEQTIELKSLLER